MFTRYEADRRPWEERMLQNYRQYKGEYDPSIKLDPNRSKAYPKVTRAKCISTVARLMQMLFPVVEKNWSIKPSPVPNMSAENLTTALNEITDPAATEEAVSAAIYNFAKTRAEAMEKEMEDQLVELGGTKELPYVSLCKKVIEGGTKYGVGVLKGPLVREQEQTRWRRNPLTGQFEISRVKAYRPYYEVTSPWNYYPDMSAKTFASMDGQFERHPMNRRQLQDLANVPGFDKEQIHTFIAAHKDGNFTWRNFETQLRQMGTQERALDAAGKYEALEYWGAAKAGELREAGVVIDDPTIMGDQMVEAHVWLLNQCVIKAEVSPYDTSLRPYHHFVFEEDDSSLTGEGLPYVMRDSQLGICAATRMIVDNAAVSAGPILEVNRTLLAPDTDTKTIHAFKVFEREDEGASASTPAVREVRVDSHVAELTQVLNTFREFADMETFITPAMNGDFTNSAKEPFRTTGGASMILAGASLPLRDIVRNFDAFTLSVITSLYLWNTQFNDKAEIKGDYQVAARGAASLIAKEVRAQSLDQFAATLTAAEAEYVDPKALVTERAMVRDLPVTELLLSEDAVRAQREAKIAQSERADQLQRELIEAEIKQTVGSAVQKLAQAKKAGAAADKLLAEVLNDATGNNG
ncbi:MAG: portal protein [Opitutaceae bacterium]